MTLSRRWVVGAVGMVLLMAGSLLAYGQEVSGSISGTVVDPNGASVSGAVVTITNTDRAHVERTAKTDKAGFYTATSLPLGSYSVSFAMTGFKTATVTGVVLNANDQLKVDQKLIVGAATESLTITADQANVNLENGQSMGLVTGTQIHELVLNNRNYEQLLTLQPGVSYGGANDQLYIGVSLPQGTSAAVAFSINGDRPTANNWTIDGADNVDRGANLTLLAYPSVDAIAEFSTLRGTYAAEYGRGSSGQINVVTRSGANAFHGGAYEFFRNNVFNANDYFNKITSPFTPRPVLRYNDFGFTLGGPVILPHLYNGRDKTFFFYSEEFRRVVNYAVATALVPTAAERTGDFTNSYLTTAANGTTYNGNLGPVGVCGSFNVATGACLGYTTNLTGQISPAAAAYIKDVYGKVPLPNSQGNIAAHIDPHTINNNIRNVFNDNQEFARVDHALGRKTNLFYRYLHDNLPSMEGAGLFVGNGMPGVSTTTTRAPGTQHMGHATIAVKPTMLVDLGYAYSSGAVISTPVGYASGSVSRDVVSAMTLPYSVTLGIVPSLSFGNVAGISSAGIYNDYDRNHNGFGDITKVVGQHTFKFGLSYNHYQKQENSTGNGSPFAQGLFSFTNATAPSASTLAGLGTSVSAPSAFDSQWANFLLGNANAGFSQGSAALDPAITENLIELYGQDDWRATRRLTLNLGVRYSYFGQPFDDNHELTNFNPNYFTRINAETIASNGNLCTTAGQTTFTTAFTNTGVVTTYTLNNCPNLNGLNGFQPSAVADPLNGIMIGSPDYITAATSNTLPFPARNFPFTQPAGAPSIESHGSPFNQEVGQAEKHDFAPRVGFAYDLFGNGRTALRGGYGMFYDQSAVHNYELEVFTNPPFLCQTNYTSAQLGNPVNNGNTLAGPCATGAPPNLYATMVQYKTPYVQDFSLDLQQQITRTTVLDVGYFGEHGTHLQGIVDINQVRPGSFLNTSISYTQVPGCTGFTSGTCEGPLNQLRPYPGYTAINDVLNIFNQNYNSLQAKFTKHFSGKSLIDVNYSWSRGLTNAQSDYSSAPQNTYNLNAEYGPSIYNRSDILNVDGVWELPWMRAQHGIAGKVLGGWELSGIWALNSGLPLTATMSGGGTISYGPTNSVLTSTYNGQTNGGVANDAGGLDIIGPSASSLRPDMVLNPNQSTGGVQLHTRLHWFNQTAFVAPPPSSYRVGNERRGVVNGPGFDRFDFGLFRSFNLWRDAKFTVRGEGYNVFNHTNFSTIGTSATSSAFGTATADRGPRILQVGGKFDF